MLGGNGQLLDLSDLHVQFHVYQAETSIPNWATIRVFNLSDATLSRVQGEFQYIHLAVGYGGNVATLFKGQIRQFNAGRRVNATDTFIDFVCQDGDEGYNWSFVNQTLAAGWTYDDVRGVAHKAFGEYDLTPGYQDTLPGVKFPRGKVLYGAARDHMDSITDNTGISWSIFNGNLVGVKLTGSLPQEAISLTPSTGLINLPQQTVDGITLRCLINPKIRYGSLIHLDNQDIQTASVNIAYGAVNYIPGFDKNGLYHVYCANHTGDTRGNDWYSDIICVARSGGLPLTSGYINYIANG